MNKLFFIAFFLLQMSNGMIFASQDKTDLFIQKFPRLTFPQAKEEFGKLSIARQRHIWRKLDTNEKDKDKILPLALHMAHMEPTLQYVILMNDFTLLEKLNKKNKNASIQLPDQIYKNSIYDLFVWTAVINKKCKSKYFIEDLFGYYKKKIELTKQELFMVTIDQLSIIRKKDNKILTTQELRLLAELPDSFNEKMSLFYSKGRYTDYPRKIKFSYHERPTLKSPVMSIIDALVFILPPLLFNTFCTHPTWDTLIGEQDPIALEQNIKKNLCNQIIDRLQQENINGSEYLMRKTIREVPFEYTNADLWELIKPIGQMSFLQILLCAYITNANAYNKYEHSDSLKSGTHQSSWMWRTMNSLLLNQQKLNIYRIRNKDDFFIAFFTLCFNFFFSLLTTNFLYNIPLPIQLHEVIEISVILAISVFTISTLCAKRPWKCIDFSKGKFKDKSVKECINYYLNHPKIVILD